MKRIAALAACAALQALAEEPGDFASTAPITPNGRDALQRFVLPFEAYRDARRDLADIRVFNARGEPVPIALAMEPETAREAPRTTALAHFPVTSLAVPREAVGAEVTVRTRDGTLVAVRGRGVARPAAPVAYLLDASLAKEPLAALVFDWDAAPGTEVVKVGVEASDDLQSWHGVAHSSLVRVAQGERVLEQPRVQLVPTKARYFRVTWGGGSFALRGVRGEFELAVKPPERSMVAVPASAAGKAGEFMFDLGARLPVEAVRVVPTEPNSVATFAVAARDSASSDWGDVGSAVFYRLVRDSIELQSGPLEVGRRPAREWRVRVDPRVGGIGSAAPMLEVQWRSAQVVFVARGDAPFTLAFGDHDAKPAWVAVASLVPGYRRGDEGKIAEARVGPVASGAVRGASWPAWAAEIGPRKLALWAILVAAVAMLGFMAWRLNRQMRAHRDVPREPLA